MTDDPGDLDAAHRPTIRRIWIFALAAWLIFALWETFHGGWKPLISLTCSALVSMINFLWLEEIAVRILRPAPRASAWRLGCRALSRFALFGVVISVLILIAHFDAISVLLGFSVVVVGIMGEAVYGAFAARAD